MASLIGKALAVRNAGPPVPLGSSRFSALSGIMPGGDDDAANMRAYSTQGTVFANVSLLAGSTAAPEWKLYKKQPQDGRRRYTTNDQGSDQRTEVVKHQALTVLTTPASIMVNGTERVVWSRFALFELSQIWMECTGKSYWVVQRDPRSSIPMGLWPVRPDRVQPVPDPDNYLAGFIYNAPDGREKIPLGVDEVIFNRYPDPLDIYGGTGPIQSVLTDVDSSRYAAEWNRNYFINSAEPGGVIEVEDNLDDNEWRKLTERWREGHKGVARAHRVAVLEGGQKWVPNAHTLRDMDFNNLRGTGRDIIREALGMHKVMTGVTDDVNRANAQTGEEVFASWKIKPRLDRWKDVINTQFLPLFGSTAVDVEFDYSFPMPLNREQDNEELAAKANAAQVLVTAGYDPHDVLEVVGLPDMDVVETATQAPALPPGWVPGTAPGVPAEPAGPGAPSAPDDPGDNGGVTTRIERLLARAGGRDLAAWNHAGSRQ
jgi:HK97 family phage portal protein